MMDLMSMDPDPKFQNSQFLQFLSKLKTGEYKIEKNQLIVNPQIQEQNLENAFSAAQQHVEEQKSAPLGADKFAFAEEEKKMDAMWQEENDEDDLLDEGDKKIDAIFDKVWKNAQQAVNDPKYKEEMEKEYKDLLASMGLGHADEMGEALQEAWDAGEEEAKEEDDDAIQKEYQFRSENPYETIINPLDKAAERIASGNRIEAIMALESHLQKNPKDLKAWRLLGKLHQENDQDRKALPCFLVNFTALMHLMN